MLILSPFVSSDLLAQLVERGANNAKVVSSRLIRTSFHDLSGLLSVFNKFVYNNRLKMLILRTFSSVVPIAQWVERSAINGQVPCSRLIWTRFHFLFGLLSLFK